MWLSLIFNIFLQDNSFCKTIDICNMSINSPWKTDNYSATNTTPITWKNNCFCGPKQLHPKPAKVRVCYCSIRGRGFESHPVVTFLDFFPNGTELVCHQVTFIYLKAIFLLKNKSFILPRFFTVNEPAAIVKHIKMKNQSNFRKSNLVTLSSLKHLAN